MSRLLHTGQVIVDLVMALDTLPATGGDVLAQSATFEAGGGFNVMAAAQRNGTSFGEEARASGRVSEQKLAAAVAEDLGMAVQPDVDPGRLLISDDHALDLLRSSPEPMLVRCSDGVRTCGVGRRYEQGRSQHDGERERMEARNHGDLRLGAGAGRGHFV